MSSTLEQLLLQQQLQHSQQQLRDASQELQQQQTSLMQHPYGSHSSQQQSNATTILSLQQQLLLQQQQQQHLTTNLNNNRSGSSSMPGGGVLLSTSSLVPSSSEASGVTQQQQHQLNAIPNMTPSMSLLLQQQQRQLNSRSTSDGICLTNNGIHHHHLQQAEQTTLQQPMTHANQTLSQKQQPPPEPQNQPLLDLLASSSSQQLANHLALLQPTKPLQMQRQEYDTHSLHLVAHHQEPPQPRRTAPSTQPTTSQSLLQPTIATNNNLCLLHQACRLYASTPTVIECALKADYTSASRPCTSVRNNRGNPCHYVYPINIALKHNASIQVLTMLAQAAPHVLSLPDGPQASGSLAIAILQVHQDSCKENSKLSRVLDLFLKANPACVSTMDRKGNYPLHVACIASGRGGAVSVETIEKLVQAYPKALTSENFHGQSPLKVAQCNGNIIQSCDKVVNYLQQVSFDALEQVHMDLDENDD